MEARWRPSYRAWMILFLFFIYMISVVSSRASKTEEKVNYNGWRVIEVLLDDGSEGDRDGTRVLQKLQEMEKPAYLEILRARRDKGVAEVAVSQDALVELRDKQQEDQIKFSTVVHDLGKKLEIDSPSLRAEPLASGVTTFDRFMKTNEILAYVKSLPEKYANKVTLERIGSSVDNQPIYMVTITSNIRRRSLKPIIFIDGGVHAREWISPAAAVYTIKQLLKSPSLTSDIEWRIIPLLNPDGYKYCWTHDRLWRKNRASRPNDYCSGTDLNRNFGYHWGETGSSDNPCSSIYRGPEAFSEPESRALRDAMLPVKDRIHAYISIHSYGQMILYPWGYTSERDRYNAPQLQSVGEGMAQVIKNNDGTLFTTGSAAKVLYAAAGGSDDWAAGVLKVPLSYTFELKDEGYGGFVLPEDQIMSAVTDFWLAMKHLGKQLKKKEGLVVKAEAEKVDNRIRTGLQAQDSVEAGFQVAALEASVAGSVTKQGQAVLPEKVPVKASTTDGSINEQSEEAPVSRDAAIQGPETAVVQEPIVQLPQTQVVKETVTGFAQVPGTPNRQSSSNVNLKAPLVERVQTPLFTFAKPSQITLYRRSFYDSSEEDSSSSSSSEESSEESDEDK